jgi:hypothetical protein
MRPPRWLHLLLLLLPLGGTAQVSPPTPNLLDSLGQRHGEWAYGDIYVSQGLYDHGKKIGTWTTYLVIDDHIRTMWEEDFEEDGSVWKYNFDNSSITHFNHDSSKVESRVFPLQLAQVDILCLDGQCVLTQENQPDRQFPIGDLELEQNRFRLHMRSPKSHRIHMNLRILKW